MNGSLGDNLSALLEPTGLAISPLQKNGLQWTVTSIPKANSEFSMFAVVHPLKITSPPPFKFSPVLNSIMSLRNTKWMDTDGEDGIITPIASRSGIGLVVTQTWDVQVQILQMLK